MLPCMSLVVPTVPVDTDEEGDLSLIILFTLLVIVGTFGYLRFAKRGSSKEFRLSSGRLVSHGSLGRR